MYGLFLRDLEVLARIGAHDFELERPQRLLVNIALALDHSPTSDTLSDVTDYDFIRRQIDRILGEGHITLQETLCRRIVEACRQQPRVAAVKVSTQKTDVYVDAAAVGCRMVWFASDDVRAEALMVLGGD